jgi:PAS domain S-box-containing protein
MEEQKNESEVQFRNLADLSPNMLFINQKGRVVYVNRKCEEIMGYSSEEFTAPAFQFLNLMWGESRERGWKNFLRHASGEEVPPTEYTMLTREGKKIHGILSTQIIRYQEEPAILGTITDITARKAAESALTTSEQMYRALIRTSPDAIIVTDPVGIITEVSSHSVDQFGCGSPQELTGSDLRALIAPEAWETMEKALGKAREYGSFRNLELSLVRKNGTSFLGEVNVSVVRDLRQAPSAMVFAVRDIGQRREREADLARIERLESLGVLAGGIAHDFNNILTAISTNISMAQMYGNLDDETSKMLADAETAATRANNLTQQLLTFSKGGQPVKKPISLARLLVETTEFTLSGSNVICRYDIPEDLLALEADEGQLSQMIQNLILNAKQAMPEGGTIRIRAKNLMEKDGESALVREGNLVRIWITDQGTGIPAKHLNRIFDPFFTTKHKGSGLGLSTTFSVVSNHDGQIRVQSEAGHGTTFTITLPATNKPVEPSTDRKAPAERKKGKILIIDDDKMVRRSAGRTLRRLGYSVSFASDGARGIGTYIRARESGTPFDTVIMDVTIPGGMGGKEAIAELLKQHPEARVIVSSGYSNDPVMAHYREYGFQGVIQKPYKVHELGAVVEKVLRDDSTEEGS